ncbi:MAG TPA: NAD(P)/FAD-dependent oxidoreductase [Jatrophihabitantaceae bacterium]|jgi:flavin-dependent dehydrogenase
MTAKVLVVGGGPGGSIAATFLAQGGADVTLLEREHFPRYHIGESVAPSCRAIIEFAGAAEKVDARDYPVKRGVLLRWGAESDWAVNWRDMFGEDIRSWQVDRDDFDHVLLKHAASQGAKVVEGATVKRINFDGDRAMSADWTQDGTGTVHTTEFDHVVDASGRAGILSRKQFHNRRPHEVFRNVAIWGYYPGGQLLPGTPPGGIDVISSPNGWYWVIPLRGGQFSVGYVTHQDNFLALPRADLRALFSSLVDASPTVRDLVAGHELAGDIRVEQDFSYVADSFCGPGYFLAGDAACFLDPLLSTGVHLALFSGMLSAASILAIDAGDVAEAEAGTFYENLYRNAYARMLALVAGMYDKYRGRMGYFWLAQKLMRPEQVRAYKPDNAFGAIVAGLTDLEDASRRGGVAPMLSVIEAAERARVRADVQVPNAGTTTAPMKMDANDLYDAESGLYMVTTPRLSIARAHDRDLLTPAP